MRYRFWNLDVQRLSHQISFRESHSRQRLRPRRLQYEALEDRSLLAAVGVVPTAVTTGHATTNQVGALNAAASAGNANASSSSGRIAAAARPLAVNQAASPAAPIPSATALTPQQIAAIQATPPSTSAEVSGLAQALNTVGAAPLMNTIGADTTGNSSILSGSQTQANLPVAITLPGTTSLAGNTVGADVLATSTGGVLSGAPITPIPTGPALTDLTGGSGGIFGNSLGLGIGSSGGGVVASSTNSQAGSDGGVGTANSTSGTASNSTAVDSGVGNMADFATPASTPAVVGPATDNPAGLALPGMPERDQFFAQFADPNAAANGTGTGQGVASSSNEYGPAPLNTQPLIVPNSNVPGVARPDGTGGTVTR